MAYSRRNPFLICSILACIISLSFFGCFDRERKDLSKTYYVELINFSDSLKKIVSAISGKAALNKSGKIEVLSLNYVTEDHGDMHYFKLIEEIKEPIEKGCKKVTVRFDGTFSIDSVRYFMNKSEFRDQQWIKVSDIGSVKGFSTYKNKREFAMKEYGNQIINNIAAYTYN